jgi:integrase
MARKNQRMRYIDWHEAHGLWRVRPIIDGRRLRAAYFEADDLEEAVAYRDRVLHEAHKGEPTLPGTQTVGWLCEKWLAQRRQEMEDGELARNTYRDYERVVRLHIANSDLGRRRLRVNLTPHISDLLTEKAREGLRPSYRRRILVVLRQAFDMGERWNLIPRNYAKQVKPPRVPLPKPDAWTESEARQFLEASATSPMHTLWTFLLHTGARMGEACGLRWEDVRLDTSPATVAFVQQRLRGAAGEPKFGRLKTERSHREIPIDAVLAERLLVHREATRQLREITRSDLVFLSEHGTPLDLSNVGRRWRADVTAAAVRYLKPHGARSTHATITAARGSRLEEVSRRLGHSTTAFTADVYYKSGGAAALSPALHIAEALSPVEVLGSVLGSQST